MFRLTKEQKTQTEAKRLLQNRANLYKVERAVLKELTTPTYPFVRRAMGNLSASVKGEMLEYAKARVSLAKESPTLYGIDKDYPRTGVFSVAAGNSTKRYQQLTLVNAGHFTEQLLSDLTGGDTTSKRFNRFPGLALGSDDYFEGLFGALRVLFAMKEFETDDFFFEFKGEGLVEAYQEAWGCPSCMTGIDSSGKRIWKGEEKSPVQLYARNPETVSLAAFKLEGIQARAVVWKSVAGDKYLDRIYSSGNSRHARTLMIAWCIKNDVIPIRSLSLSLNVSASWALGQVNPSQPYEKETNPVFRVGGVDGTRVPYIDSMRYVMLPSVETAAFEKGTILMTFPAVQYRLNHKPYGGTPDRLSRSLTFYLRCSCCSSVNLHIAHDRETGTVTGKTSNSKYGFALPSSEEGPINCDEKGNSICPECQSSYGYTKCARCKVLVKGINAAQCFCAACFAKNAEAEKAKAKEVTRLQEMADEEKRRSLKARPLAKKREEDAAEAFELIKEREAAARPAEEPKKKITRARKAVVTKGGHEPEIE